MIKVKKLYVITGVGGSRKDFVTGWLGKLPNFIDTRWFIDLTTGASLSDVQHLKIMDVSADHTFANFLKGQDIHITENAEFNLAVTCHGMNVENNVKDLRPDQYEIIRIDIEDESMNDVHWQSFVKNFLHYNRGIDSLRANDYHNQILLKYPYGTGELLSINEHIKKIEDFFPKIDPRNTPFESGSLPLTKFSYKELFANGDGSRVLEERLKLQVPIKVHNYWNVMLEFADSPDEIEFLGRVWKKSDYFR